MPDVCLFFVLLFTIFIIVVTQKLVLQRSKNVTAKCTENLSPPPCILYSLRKHIQHKCTLVPQVLFFVGNPAYCSHNFKIQTDFQNDEKRTEYQEYLTILQLGITQYLDKLLRYFFQHYDLGWNNMEQEGIRFVSSYD